MRVKIGETVARERRKAGITQEELAGRLGVTKAAVSKWELGQSLPDAALLPGIAAQFSITIDELFGWREQLDADEVEGLAGQVRALLAQDAAAGAALAGHLAREHRTCWPLLVRLATELVGAAQRRALAVAGDGPDDAGTERARGAAEELADQAAGLCEQVEDGCGDPALAFDAARVRASALVARGDFAGAVALLEPLHGARPRGVGVELSHVQALAGRPDDAGRTLRECAASSGLEVASVLSSLLARASTPDEVAAYVDAFEALDCAVNLTAASAPVLPAAHIAAATVAHALGDDAGALDLLGWAADEVLALLNGRLPGNPRGGRYGLVPDGDGADGAALARMRRSPSFADYPETAARTLLDTGLWGPLAETEPYRKLASRIREKTGW